MNSCFNEFTLTDCSKRVKERCDLDHRGYLELKGIVMKEKWNEKEKEKKELVGSYKILRLGRNIKLACHW